MSTTKKLVRVREYAAEVEVQLIDGDAGWAPYLSVSDADKLDDVREALESGDLERASQFARVFRLTPHLKCKARPTSTILTCSRSALSERFGVSPAVFI